MIRGGDYTPGHQGGRRRGGRKISLPPCNCLGDVPDESGRAKTEGGDRSSTVENRLNENLEVPNSLQELSALSVL